MGTTADKLNYLKESIDLLKNTLKDKGINITGNTPLRECVEKVSEVSGGVPKGFTELQYLEKTVQDNSYIDLGYKATPNTGFALDFTITAFTSASYQQILIGYCSKDNSEKTSFAIYFWYSDGSGSNKFSSCATLQDTDSGLQAWKVIEAGTKYRFSVLDNKYSINGETEIEYFTKTSNTTADNLYLFRANSPNSSLIAGNNSIRGKVYSLKIYEGDEIVRDLVPVQRKDTAIYGLYDKVTGYFLPVSLNSSFTGVAK